jgi:hypothetical protein
MGSEVQGSGFKGSGFWVQRLEPMDTAYTVYQDPEYLTYPVGRNGFMNTMKLGLFRYKLFMGFNPER